MFYLNLPELCFDRVQLKLSAQNLFSQLKPFQLHKVRVSTAGRIQQQNLRHSVANCFTFCAPFSIKIASEAKKFRVRCGDKPIPLQADQSSVPISEKTFYYPDVNVQFACRIENMSAKFSGFDSTLVTRPRGFRRGENCTNGAIDTGYK
jgi:hypothetical protein